MWGTVSDSHMNKLDSLHAKAANIIYNIKENCSDEMILQKLTGNQLVTCIKEDC